MKSRNIGIFLSYTNILVNMVCGLLLSVFLLRKLGATDYGVYQAVATFVNCLVLLEFGTGTAMARNLVSSLARGRNEENLARNISTIWGIACFLSLIIFIVSIIFYLLIEYIYAKSMTASQIADAKGIFIFMAIYLMVSFATQTLSGMPLAFEDYSFSAKISIFRNTLRTIFIVIIVLYYQKAIMVAIIDSCLSILLFLFTYVYCRKKFKVDINFSHFDKAVLKLTLPFCFALFLQIVVTQTNSTVGKFITSVMLAPEKVALYSIGLYIFGIFSSIATIPVSMYMPQIANDITSGMNGLTLTKSLIQPSRLIVLISGLIAFGFIAAGRQFITILYGHEFIQAWLIAVILIVPMFINMSNAVVINVLDIKNKRHIRSLIMMASTVINIFLTIIWLKMFDVIGAAYSTGLSTIIMLILTNWYYSRAIGIKVMYLYQQAYKGILIYQILGAGVAYIAGTAVSNVYCSFAISSIVFIIIAGGGFLLHGINTVEKKFFQKIIFQVKSIFHKRFYCN